MGRLLPTSMQGAPVIELRRITVTDWYLFRAEQIDFAGMTALIGPNGAGKSAIIDAAQMVLTGANMTSIRFNASAQSASRSKRSIRDYCLGVVSLDERGERSQPTRDAAYTYAILGFVDVDGGDALNLGIAFSANAARVEERCEARFMVKGRLLGQADLLEPVGDDSVETRQWHAVRTALRAEELEVVDDFASASDFVEEGLRALSPKGYPLDPRRFIKAFRNALLLKPVENPTEFVRNYVLDVPTIKVDRLRRSIELYRDLVNKIETLKAQTASLAQIQRVVARVLDNERTINIAQWQIARLLWEGFRRRVRDLQVRMKELHDDATRKEAAAVTAGARVSRIEVDLSQLELTIKATDGQQLAQMYESDRDLEKARRDQALIPMKLVEQLVRRVETIAERRIVAAWDETLHGLLSAVTLAYRPVKPETWSNTLEEGWEDKAAALDAALSAVTSEQLAAVRQRGEESFFHAQKEVHDIQEQIDLIDRNLARLDSGKGALERGTEALQGALDGAGISSVPLCDVVEVKNEKWRTALEAVLGRSREALLVEPEHAVRALDVYRRGNQNAFLGAEVVNTTKTAQTRPPDKGSLATVLTTDHRHARAFIDFRLGRLMMVETMEKMVALENAVTPDRMMQSGRTVKRLAHPGILKLGRANDEEARRQYREDRAALTARLAEKAVTARRLGDDSSIIQDVVRGFQDVRSQGIVCVAIGETLVEADKKIADLNNNIDEALGSRDPKLLQKQAALEAELHSARAEKSQTHRVWQTAYAAEHEQIGDYKTVIREHDKLRQQRQASARLLKSCEGESAKFEPVVRKLRVDAMDAEIEGREADVQWRTGDRRVSLQRELTSGLLKHCQQFGVSLPFTDEEANADAVGAWASEVRKRLETHELVQYEDQCKNAAGEMANAFRDDLLHRLHDAFEGIRETLDELNRHLKDRLFHGRDYYIFRSSPDPTHLDMIDLVKESRRPEFQLPLFASGKPGESEAPALRAMRHIEQILSDPEAKTEELEDPRKYFNFELYVQDKDGRIRSSLSSRAGTGSGGEGQLPFYIAIGASLAATYQNRRTGKAALALAVFDEAFNRLDTKAIAECSDFMRSLGLQVMVATPDEKRHIFMEVADTIVNVNRSENMVLVESEYLTDKTRDALTQADPYRKGFDGFKAEVIRASGSPDEVAERKEAAE